MLIEGHQLTTKPPRSRSRSFAAPAGAAVQQLDIRYPGQTDGAVGNHRRHVYDLPGPASSVKQAVYWNRDAPGQGALSCWEDTRRARHNISLPGESRGLKGCCATAVDNMWATTDNRWRVKWNINVIEIGRRGTCCL